MNKDLNICTNIHINEHKIVHMNFYKDVHINVRINVYMNIQEKISFSSSTGLYKCCHTRAPSWILSQAENLASVSLQDGATKWYYFLVWTTHPPTAKLFL